MNPLFRSFVVLSLAGSVGVAAQPAALRSFEGTAASWAYGFLKAKGGREESSSNGGDKCLRVSASRLVCSRFFGPGEGIPAYRCTFFMKDATGEEGEYVAGGLNNGGADTLHQILAAMTEQGDHVGVRQLQCLKFEGQSYRCGVR